MVSDVACDAKRAIDLWGDLKVCVSASERGSELLKAFGR